MFISIYDNVFSFVSFPPFGGRSSHSQWHSIRMSFSTIHMFISEDKLRHLLPFAHPVVIVDSRFFSLAAPVPLLYMCHYVKMLKVRNFSTFFSVASLLALFVTLTHWPYHSHPHKWDIAEKPILFSLIYYLYKYKTIRSAIKFNCKCSSVPTTAAT